MEVVWDAPGVYTVYLIYKLFDGEAKALCVNNGTKEWEYIYDPAEASELVCDFLHEKYGYTFNPSYDTDITDWETWSLDYI